MWKLDGPQCYESDKICHLVVPYTRGRGLDLGVGLRKVWPHVIGVDNLFDYKGVRPEPVDVISDCDKLPMFADGSMDFVYSSHLLEHFKEEDVPAILNEWGRMVKPGGYLILYVPSANLYPKVGENGANPDHKWNIYPGDIERKLQSGTTCGWTQIECEERGKPDDNEYSILEVYQKRTDGQFVKDVWQRNPQGKKRCLVIRYGAIGDQIMAASVLPGLKDQGYYITYNTTENAGEVVKNNPNIDEFLFQDRDQVPNMQLVHYWKALKERYDKVVNLSETVEGSLLYLPGRPMHEMSHEARDLLAGNINYLDLQHDVAGVPRNYSPCFCPTAEEVAEAKKKLNAINPDRSIPTILWALTGSAPHKTYPFVNVVMAWLLEKTPAHIIMTGDATTAKELEDGILATLKETPGLDLSRVHATCGKWSIRETLSIAEQVDCVVGPETGVLNSVSFLDIPKVIYLSHSSEVNLTRDWKNTKVLKPETSACPCYPCHQLHYGFDFCTKVETTGAALCASSIAPEDVFKAISLSVIQTIQPALEAAE